MIKQGETLLMVGKLERTPTDSTDTVSIADLSSYGIYVALTQGNRVVKQLLVTKEAGYFTATLPPESTCRLQGDFGIEAAMVVDGTTIISDNVSGITIESSALGRALHRLTPDSSTPSYIPEEESEAEISNVSNTYNYCIKLSIVGSEVAIDNPTEDDEQLFTLTFEKMLVGKSAYEIAVDYGYEGTEEEWVNSLLQSDLSNLAPASITSTMINFPEYLSVKLLDNDGIDIRTSGIYAVCNYNPDSVVVISNNIYRLLIVSNATVSIDGGITTMFYQTLITGNTIMQRTGTYTSWTEWVELSPSMRNFYTAKGDFTYNSESGYYEKGCITDLTESDMADIFATYTYTYCTDDGAYAYSTARATPTFNVFSESATASYHFAYSDVELVDFGSRLSYWIMEMANEMFIRCKSLREICGIIDLCGATNLSNMFYQCEMLEKVQIDFLEKSLSFASSPLLSAESVYYIITHSDTSNTITLTLHEDCYNRLVVDEMFSGGLDFYASLFNIAIAVA